MKTIHRLVLKVIFYEVLIVFVLYLHFANLMGTPGWYPDEGTEVNLAQNLGSGRFQYFAIQGTPLIAARTPLLHLMVVAAAQFFDYSLFTARLVVAVANVLTLLVLYLAVRQMFGEEMALLAGAIWFLPPFFLAYHRMAFTYNVLTLFYVLGWWFIWRFAETHRTRWLVLSALAAGAAYMTALLGLGLLLAMAILVLWYRPRALLWFLLLAALPGLLFLGVSYVLAPDLLVQDFLKQAQRGGGFSLFSLYVNSMVWFDWVGWIGLGILGFLAIEDKRLAGITQVVFFTGMVFSMRFAPGELSLHHFLQLLPFVAVGAAHALLKVRDHLKREANRDVASLVQRLPFLERYRSLLQRLAALSIWVVLFSLLLFYGLQDYGTIAYGKPNKFFRQIDLVLVRDPEAAIAVTDYVNRHTGPEDIVVASPHIAWRVKANATDFEQFLAYQGLPSVNYGEGVPPERFAFAPLLENTKFVIVDNMWEEWAIPYEMPVLQQYLQRIQSSWDLVLERGDFKVYRNPAFSQQG